MDPAIESAKDLSDFKDFKIIWKAPLKIYMLATHVPTGNLSLVHFNYVPFEKDLETLVPRFEGILEEGQQNSETTSTFVGSCERGTFLIKMHIVSPVPQKLILKYSDPKYEVILETVGTYESITKPWIATIPASDTKWIENLIRNENVEHEEVYVYDPDPDRLFTDAQQHVAK